MKLLTVFLIILFALPQDSCAQPRPKSNHSKGKTVMVAKKQAALESAAIRIDSLPKPVVQTTPEAKLDNIKK